MLGVMSLTGHIGQTNTRYRVVPYQNTKILFLCIEEPRPTVLSTHCAVRAVSGPSPQMKLHLWHWWPSDSVIHCTQIFVLVSNHYARSHKVLQTQRADRFLNDRREALCSVMFLQISWKFRVPYVSELQSTPLTSVLFCKNFLLSSHVWPVQYGYHDDRIP